LWLDRGEAIVFEPRMTGLLLIDEPADPLYDRVRLKLRGGEAKQLVYWDRRGVGNVRLCNEAEFAQKVGLATLGPDALEMTAELDRGSLGQSERAVKVALLDQQAGAWIGNLYAPELLHLARIRPTRTCRQLKRKDWEALAAAALEVLETAIRYEGSTLS